MLTFLLHRQATGRPRFYRVDVSYNLFGEYSVLREWGARGSNGRQLTQWFSNLREACLAAEAWRRGAQRRGYAQRPKG